MESCHKQACGRRSLTVVIRYVFTLNSAQDKAFFDGGLLPRTPTQKS
jgi:hypothetical protein